MIVMRDAEALCVNALNRDFETLMPGVEWGTRVPNPRPPAFGRLLLAGGTQETMVTDTPQVIIEGWADDETTALQIVNLGRAILLAQDGLLFGGFVIGAPSNLPDPSTSQTRYTAMLGIRVRASIA